jgi:hypothetical protein
MTTAPARCVAFLTLALVAGACSDSSRSRTPTPTHPSDPSPAPSPTPAPSDEASRVFVFASTAEPPHGLSAYTLSSEYRLTDAGRFTLWYSSVGKGYGGTYTEADGLITFKLDGLWAATGLLRDQTLTVRYNFEALLDGFEDAAYMLKR